MKSKNSLFYFEDIPLDTTSISQPLLNIEKKERSNPFSWKGQFSPQFVQVLLQKYASRTSVILDPFAGSGTVLYEAGRENLQAIGAEINPASYIMARTYHLINVKHSIRKSFVEEIDKAIEKVIFVNLPLFLGRPISSDNDKEIKSQLLKIYKKLTNSGCRDLFETLIVRLDFYKHSLTNDRLLAVWDDLRKFVMVLPYSNKPLNIINCDARRLPVHNNSIDLVITSPPYINVFNYHQQYRASIEALGWDILSIAKSEIGSNRKYRSNRFLTVIQYCLDIAQALSEVKRVCKNSARIVFVVGRESTVRSTRFFNGQIVAALGVFCVGLNFDTRQERVFKNKFGTLIYEDILHFTVSKKKSDNLLQAARNVAREVLKDAINIAPEESKDEIIYALGCVNEIQPSPLYDKPDALAKGKIYANLLDPSSSKIDCYTFE